MNKILILLIALSSYIFAVEPIVPIPLHVHVNKQQALLGKKLFMDPILSSDKSVSCLSCHNIFTAGGADKRRFSIGVGGQKDDIHSPTVLNAVYNFRQFYNGRAKNLAQQINGPLHNPIEMNMTDSLIEKRLNASKYYKKLFYNVYKTKHITYKETTEAIVAFEDALTTPNSLFDKYLRDQAKLSKKQMQGYKDFKQLGCITCHNGINIGGNMMQKIGIFHVFINKKQYPDLYSITKNPKFKNVFKVPSLRNIALRAPYFHNGSAKTLHDAVKEMGYYQLGVKLSPTQIDDIIAFLKTLTGQTPAILKDVK